MIPRKIVEKGDILYMGHNGDTSTCPKAFLYTGQSMSEKDVAGIYVAYLSSYEDVAEGYARCVASGRGWVNKYIAKKQFSVLDISDEFLHYDAEEVEKEFCLQGGGYYIKWSESSDEFALCNPWNFLEYVGSRPCIRHGKFGEYKCKS
jgi:hypothetical protein